MSELTNFHQFLSQKIDQFGDSTTPEQALDMWRMIHPAPRDFEENIDAVREALADMENGDRGLELETFDTEFRTRHRID